MLFQRVVANSPRVRGVPAITLEQEKGCKMYCIESDIELTQYCSQIEPSSSGAEGPESPWRISLGFVVWVSVTHLSWFPFCFAKSSVCFCLDACINSYMMKESLSESVSSMVYFKVFVQEHASVRHACPARWQRRGARPCVNAGERGVGVCSAVRLASSISCTLIVVRSYVFYKCVLQMLSNIFGQ